MEFNKQKEQRLLESKLEVLNKELNDNERNWQNENKIILFN